jgi:jumonji domain-containing protein 7
MNGLFFNQHLAGQNLTTGAKPKGNSGGAADAVIENLISTFNELNSNVIDELHEEPSPLEFMRYVARNTPFVIRNGASSWKACREWNSAYLLSALKGQSVNVAVTPHGFV